MLILSCYPPGMDPQQPATGAFEASRQIRVALCCVYYIAYAVKMGMPPHLLREDEWKIRDDIHYYFAYLPKIRTRRGLRSNCDICSLTETIWRMALSHSDEENQAFVKSTQHNEADRAKYDWAAALDAFSAQAQLAYNGTSDYKIDRAITVTRYVQTYSPIVFIENTEPQLVTLTTPQTPITPTLLRHLTHSQLKALRHGHLRLTS